MKAAAVLLAAGLGTRAGGDKLSRRFNGIPLIETAANLISGCPFCRCTAVVRENDAAVTKAVSGAGFSVCVNPDPARGIASSLVSGLENVLSQDIPDGVMFFVGDQPALKADTVLKMLDAFSERPDAVIRPVSPSGKTGNPCLFPAALFGELLELTGDTGGRQVIRRHPERTVYVPCEEAELRDLDTALDFIAGKQL